jgi:hypothetical protein
LPVFIDEESWLCATLSLIDQKSKLAEASGIFSSRLRIIDDLGTCEFAGHQPAADHEPCL